MQNREGSRGGRVLMIDISGEAKASPAGAAAGRVLCGCLLLRQRDVYSVDFRAHRTARRCSCESSPEDAVSVDRDSVSVRNRRAYRAEVSVPKSWDLMLLPDWLFKA